ncbi:hypothetical protein TWF106_011506 [Orbilia oligospora]|uniref:RGS domain-containing protein n=2 Tax=Orbilia oligospora TaxID=2813651 RepID=A0A7C8QDB9_ORBOL|nr:hypothetical protein TWF106_011506 [Orbilia oligospora]
MLDLFYRRPTSTCSNGTFNTITSCEKGICPEIDGIPAKLSFDRVVSGYTSAPCTLEDFSRYLRFSNMNDHADALQFFVWVRRYSKRFETSLTSTEKSLSPPWENVSPALNFDSSSQVSINYPSSNNSSKADLSQVGFGDDIVLEPFTIQPFRAEVDRVSSLYLVPNSPLFLPLTAKEKAATMTALNRTTHPSAFTPALISIELSLRSTAHPSFIRHSLSNATHTRLSFISVIAFTLTILSIFALILLTLSRLSRWYRLITYLFLFPGLNIIANARRGLCLLLVVLGIARNLSPWEVYAVDDRESFEAGAGGKSEIEVGISEIDAELEGKVKDEETRIRWFVKEYDNRPILSRVFEKRVPVKDPEIRHLQLSMIVQNAIISFGITTAIEIIFVVLPRGHLF